MSLLCQTGMSLFQYVDNWLEMPSSSQDVQSSCQTMLSPHDLREVRANSNTEVRLCRHELQPDDEWSSLPEEPGESSFHGSDCKPLGSSKKVAVKHMLLHTESVL